MRTKKIVAAVKRVVSKSPNTPECISYEDCLAQAEICREQARAAARLRRFKAARGLFSTAQALYGQAVLLGGESCADARERLAQLKEEMSAYRELARSMERPLVMQVKPPTNSALTNPQPSASLLPGPSNPSLLKP